MGMNRAMRRKQRRDKMQEWVRDGTAERVRKLSVNGLTDKDLDEAYKNGYEKGYMFASTAFMKKMYAAIAKELISAGNPADDVISFLHNVDHRFAVMFDADEEIDFVFEQIGVRFVVDRNALNRVEEV